MRTSVPSCLVAWVVAICLGTAALGIAQAAAPDSSAPEDPRQRARGTIIRDDVAEEALRAARASNPTLAPLATRRPAGRRATAADSASRTPTPSNAPPKRYDNGLTASYAH